MKTLFLVLFLLLSTNELHSKNNFSPTPSLDNQLGIVLGVGQFLSGGGNVEGNLFYKRIAFDYSHGISLTFPNEYLEKGEDKTQGLKIHIPWTTGFGIGYRFNNWLNVRIEPKWHRFELYYENDPIQQNRSIGEYTTFTLGVGLYANIRPFKNRKNFLKGITIVPNIRWWPKVYSSLPENKLEYTNKITNQVEIHKTREIGIANTPYFFNLSIGYMWIF